MTTKGKLHLIFTAIEPVPSSPFRDECRQQATQVAAGPLAATHGTTDVHSTL